jgi:hypothetical protein
MKKGKLVHWFIISTFVSLYLAVSIISTLHVIRFFELSNPYWLSVSLAIAFELGAAASLASLIVLDKMNKFLVWSLFIVLTLFQSMGNVYYAYVNLHDFAGWVELFDLVDEDLIYQKRILSMISGGILPFVALGFIKSLVDYIRPPKEVGEAISISEETPIELKDSTVENDIEINKSSGLETLIDPIISDFSMEPAEEFDEQIEISDPLEHPQESTPELLDSQRKEMTPEEIETIIGFSSIEEDEEENEKEYQEEIVDANQPIPILNKDPNQSY